MLYALLPEAKRTGRLLWPGKTCVTSSYARRAVSRWIWDEGVFRQLDEESFLQKLPKEIRELLLTALPPGA